MNSQNNFKQIEHEDSKAVVSFDNGTTFKVKHFMEKLNNFLNQNVFNNLSEQLKEVGLGRPPNYQVHWNKSVKAEILEPESGRWQKGQMRIRVVLEFCPDEPEEIKNDISKQDNHSLNDIRQTIS
ncbi:MAG: hypothetical protein Tsb0014_17270 [Pleurocapsa sp.]